MSAFEDDTATTSFGADDDIATTPRVRADALHSRAMKPFNPGLSRTSVRHDDVEYSPCPPQRNWPASQSDTLPIGENSLDNSGLAEVRDALSLSARILPEGSMETPRRTGARPFQDTTPLSLPILPKNTPLSKNMNSSPDPFDPNLAADMNMRFAREAVKLVCGPVPEEIFLSLLPPIPKDRPMPDARHAFKDVPRTVKHEKEIYPPFVEAANKRCPSIKFFDTSTRPERAGRGSNKPDILGIDRRLANDLEEETDGNVYAALFASDTGAEVKPDPKDDPFCDDHDHEGNTSFFAFLDREEQDSRQSTLGQMARYAAEACARQHRTCYFSMLILGPFARLLRWDRSGVLVSKRFDYQRRPRILCEFFWRLHIANPVQRGIDPTVVVALKAEEKLFKRVITEEVRFQLGIDPKDEKRLGEAVLQHYQENNVTKIKLFNTTNSQWEEYLVSVPVASPKWVAGDSTRHYWSVKLTGPDTGEPCYLKDTWRSVVPGMMEEGLMYEEMRDANCICTLIGHGDVPNIKLLKGDLPAENCATDSPIWLVPADNPNRSECGEQSTLTQEYLDNTWFCDCLKKNKDNGKEDFRQRIHKRVHYRLVLREVGYPLHYFKCASELFEASRDTLEALMSVYEKYKRLHRNVSMENIQLVRCRTTGRWNGRLVNWESSISEDLDRTARDYFRSCDWAFASGASLTRVPDFLHSKEDDMESLFYVVLYGCMRWLPHNARNDLGHFMFDFFDKKEKRNGFDIGGGWKREFIEGSGSEFLELFHFDNRHIRRWIRQCYRHLNAVCNAQKQSQAELSWTASNFMELFKVACEGLSHDDDARFEHYVNDKHIQVLRKPYATHTQLQSAPPVMGDALAHKHAVDTGQKCLIDQASAQKIGQQKRVTFQDRIGTLMKDNQSNHPRRSNRLTKRHSLDDLGSKSIQDGSKKATG